MPYTPDFLAVGHVTWDYSPGSYDGRRPGGAAAFAAATAKALDVEATILTSSAGDYPFKEALGGTDAYINIESNLTTTFENRYENDGSRNQRLLARAGMIRQSHIPDQWRSPKLLYVGPLTQEIDYDCLSWWRPQLSCVVPQGWLREWDEPLPSRVRVDPRPPLGMSKGWDLCVVSESEVGDNALESWLGVTKILAVTKGSAGSTLYLSQGAKRINIDSCESSVQGSGRDSTGAGDVFAAAMLIRYSETGDAFESARFASVCAALSTRAIGWSDVPTRGEVGALLRSAARG